MTTERAHRFPDSIGFSNILIFYAVLIGNAMKRVKEKLVGKDASGDGYLRAEMKKS